MPECNNNDNSTTCEATDQATETKKESKRVRRKPASFSYIYIKRLLNPEKWSLQGRFVYASGAMLVVGVLATYLYVSSALTEIVNHSTENRLVAMETAFESQRDNMLENMTSTAATIVSMEGMDEALARGDQKALRKLLVPVLERIRMFTGKSGEAMQFYSLEAAPLFNSWSLKATRGETKPAYPIVAEALRDGKTIAGLQALTDDMSYILVVPVLVEGNGVGAVEMKADFADLYEQMHLPSDGGLIVLAEASNGVYTPQASFGVAERHHLNDKLNGLSVIPDRIESFVLQTIILRNYKGERIGRAVLTLDAKQYYESRSKSLEILVWLATLGALFLWLVLYINVNRIRNFLNRMKKVIIASHSNDFADRLESDAVHCLDVMSCPNKECPVYQDPSRVCYLETGDQAISPKWRNTCIFLNKYRTCTSCPVYSMRHGDEIMEMRHVVNTMMRLWSNFLSKVGMLLSEVLRAERGGMPTLDDVSAYLEQMATLTLYSHDLQGVYDKSEVYRQLEYMFEEHFGLTDYNLIEVNSSENRMTNAIDHGDIEASHRDVLVNCELCRAKRVAEDVISENNPVLCPYFDIDHATQVRVCTPMVMGGRVGAVFTFVLPKGQWAVRKGELAVIKKFLDETAPVLSSLRLLSMSKEQALRDPLTQCHNRRFLDEYLSQFEHLSARNPRKVGFIMADLDHFKMVNDEYGHVAGDHILQQLTRVLRENIRRSDLLVRYGGEEFLILLMEMQERSEAEAVAEKLRHAVEEAKLALPSGGVIKKTISLGVSEYPTDGDQLYKAIKFADVALYQAKDQGRNKVVRFTPDMWKDEDY